MDRAYVHNDDELEQAFREAMEGSRGDVKEVIIEEFIDFESEFTLLTVTQKNAPTIFCPPIGHVQKGGDYRESWQPYKISDEALKQAQHMADQVTKALTGYGIWGVEFFLTRQGEVIFSELSPRPHDTGMVTLGHTTNLSEFVSFPCCHGAAYRRYPSGACWCFRCHPLSRGEGGTIRLQPGGGAEGRPHPHPYLRQARGSFWSSYGCCPLLW